MTRCGLARLASIIILILLSFGKVVQGCAEKQYRYRLTNHNVCGICRICPKKVLKDEKSFWMNSHQGCAKWPLLPDGSNASCINHDYKKPSCEILEPSIGYVNCTEGFFLESACELVCPSNYQPSKHVLLTCFTGEGLHWDSQLPYCIGLESNHNHHQFLNDAAIICIVIFILIGVTIACIIKRRLCNSSRTIHQDAVEAPLVTNNIVIKLHQAKRHPHLQKWTATAGTTLHLEATCMTSTIKYLVLLKSNPRKEAELFYFSQPNEPNVIVLERIQSAHKGSYKWGALLEGGLKEEGEIILAVKSSNHRSAREFSPRQSHSSDEQSRVKYQTPAELATITSASNSGEAEPKPSDVLIPMPTDNPEDNDSNTQEDNSRPLRLSKTSVEELCKLWDRDECTDEVSWHCLVTDLLSEDRDFVRFIEYHLKGKMFNGPTSHTLTLLAHHGVTIDQLFKYLSKKKMSQNTHKALSILENNMPSK